MSKEREQPLSEENTDAEGERNLKIEELARYLHLPHDSPLEDIKRSWEESDSDTKAYVPRELASIIDEIEGKVSTTVERPIDPNSTFKEEIKGLAEFLGAPENVSFDELKGWWEGADSDTKAHVPKEFDTLIAEIERN